MYSTLYYSGPSQNTVTSDHKTIAEAMKLATTPIVIVIDTDLTA